MIDVNHALTDPQLQSILDRLHHASEAQDFKLGLFFAALNILNRIGLGWLLSGQEYFHAFMRGKFIALDRDKA